jgi:predicted nucleic acid-binding Zn ribbon protein
MSGREPSRDDAETITRTRRCPVCATPFTPTGRQAYCANACRQIAWRRRHTSTASIDTPPVASRRENTIYECAECEARYLGEQWCPDCTRPCRRLGTGGECSCGELLTITELLEGGPMA